MSWKTPWSQAALELFDEGLEHLGVGGAGPAPGQANICDCASRDRLAQVGFDVVVESQVEPPVDPGGHRLDGIGGAPPSSVRSRRVSARAISRKTAATS